MHGPALILSAARLPERMGHGGPTIRRKRCQPLRSVARNEGGDIDLAVKDGALEWSDVVGEIGRVLLGELPARESVEQITVYESLGLVAQDLVSAELVLRRFQKG